MNSGFVWLILFCLAAQTMWAHITHCSGDQTVFVGEIAVFSVAVSGTPP